MYGNTMTSTISATDILMARIDGGGRPIHNSVKDKDVLKQLEEKQ